MQYTQEETPFKWRILMTTYFKYKNNCVKVDNTALSSMRFKFICIVKEILNKNIKKGGNNHWSEFITVKGGVRHHLLQKYQ